MASSKQDSEQSSVHQAASILKKRAASAMESPSRRHKGKSWEAVKSARKSFFDKISNNR